MPDEGGRKGSSRSRWPQQPGQYRWIVDGHNVIFAFPDLQSLQTTGEKARARRRLEEIFERLAALFRLQVTIVYDGNRLESNPDRRSSDRVRTLYSLSPHEEADDRIVHLCTSWVREGAKVVLVSSDRALGARLPSGVRLVAPSEVLLRLERTREARGVERPAGDWSDIEAHFLSLEDEDPPEREPPRGAT
jgi:predicted RNA-binding protein with PIN domain